MKQLQSGACGVVQHVVGAVALHGSYTTRKTFGFPTSSWILLSWTRHFSFLNPLVFLPGARAVLGHKAVILWACSPRGTGHHAHAPEQRIVGVKANIKSCPPCPPQKKKNLAVSHTFPHMPRKIYLFILCTC